MYNLHNHTIHSHDGKNTVDEMCLAAIKKGLTGIAITDHADVYLYEERHIQREISICAKEVQVAQKKYAGKLDVLQGMELGEELLNKKYADNLLKIEGFDFILASRHFFPELNVETDFGYADIPLWSDAKKLWFLEVYFNALKDIVLNGNFDSLAHLTLPVRYYNSIFKQDFNFKRVDNLIIDILIELIKKDKSLELNTSGAEKYNLFMPDEYYLKIYKQLGGKKITLGSDAHIIANIDLGLEKGKQLLKKCGFTEYYYYKNRKPIIAEKL